MKTVRRVFLLVWLVSIGIQAEAVPIVLKLRGLSAAAAQWKRSGRAALPAQLSPLVGIGKVRPYVPDALLQAILGRARQLQALQSLGAQRSLAELERILIVEVPEAVDTLLLIAKLRRHPEVEYAEVLPERFLCGVPNDPLVVEQYALRLIRAFDAWDVLPVEASPLVVGVVDTGIDLTHPDLAANIFLNPGEIGTDANGQDKRFNGVDDDGNGFVDDWRGWDFAAGTGSDQDNDPSPGNGHGTHVAGILGAVVNNAVGIAGVVPRVRLLAVKIGPDAPGSSSVVNSYQGILYAAAMGAAVINCSWGGPGRSEAEHEIVRAAVALGSVVVAAAGNDSRNMPFYPAAYPEVLSVTATDSTDGKAWYANYHSSVDVSAPGDEILSTIPGGLYLRMSGTSMAAPVASGVVALVRQKFPTLSPHQAMARVMMTADPIDRSQPWLAGLIGWGRVNALSALTVERLIACRIDSLQITDSDGDGFFDAGDTLLITFGVENVLDPADSLVVSVFSPFVPAPELLRGQVSLLQMESGEWRRLPRPLMLRIPLDVPANAVMELRFSVRFGQRLVGREWTSIVLRPVYRTLGANNITVTFNSRGNIAFNDYPENLQGDGFRWKSSPNLLFEGALMAGISPERLSNVARGAVQSQQDQSFVIQKVISLVLTDISLEAEALFADRQQPGDLGVAVRQRVYQFQVHEWRDFVLVVYELVNQTAEPFTNLHVGWYLDWDISPSAQGDVALYDDSSGVGYTVCQTCSSPLPIAGAVLLSNAQVNFYAIDNDGSGSELGVYDGFTRQEKWTALSSGIARKRSRVTDASMVLAAGPLQVAPGDTVRVAFALVAGMTLEEVRRAASAARQAAAWVGIDTVPWEPLPNQMAAGVYPNPWVPGAPVPQLVVKLPEQRYVRIRLVDALGRELAPVSEGLMQPGEHVLRLPSALLGSGVYFLYITAEREGMAVPLLIVR
ncbi:Thermophilic serine proteinase [bacterium HR21]|nr:Thermophilic serine proteinase [bacterium HR21]